MTNNQKIVALMSDGHRILVLNQDGTLYNEFSIPFFPNQLFQRDDYIFANTAQGLFCYDTSGNNLWNVKDCYSGRMPRVTANANGFFVPQSHLRDEVESRELDKGNILGTKVYYPKPSQTDLWVANIDFDGNIRWHKYLQDKTEALTDSQALATNQRLVVPYKQIQENNSTITGFNILDLEGRLDYTIEETNLQPAPMALVGDKLVFYKTFMKDGKFYGQGTELNVYDIRKHTTLKIPVRPYILPVTSSGNQSGCSSIGEKVFMRSPYFIREIDLKTMKVIDYDMPNHDLAVQDGNLVVANATQESIDDFMKTGLHKKLGMAKISCYNTNLKPINIRALPDCIRDQNYGFLNFNDMALILSWHNFSSGVSYAMKINKNGDVEWKRELDTIKTLAQGI